MMSVAINGSVTLDESSGLQTSGIAVTNEDNNDSDVALNTLPAALSSRLFGAAPAGLALSSTFAGAVGAAKSADNFIAVNESGTVVSLGFTKADGTALPVLGSGTGVASGLSAISGGAISLFQDSSSLGNRLVLGVDTQGHVACALFMDPNATLTQAKVWMVQLEALSNPDATNFDDPVTMGGLGVAAGVSTEFNFNALPSGQNLFGTVGTTASGLVVIGKLPVLHPDGSFTNASDTINTSQGGGPTTIGVDNQMFDPTDGAYFTFVKNPVANFLAGAPGGLDQNEADLAGNIQYTGGTSEVNTAFVDIAQIQGNSLATMDIRCNNIAGSPQGTAFVSALGSGPQAIITAVRVFDENGAPASGVSVNITAGVARVSGVDAGYRVEWDTSTPHDQVLITGVVGKFDIGGFGAHLPSTAATPLTGIRHEDDGPRVDGGGSQVPTLTVDETTLATNASVAVGDLPQFVAAFGTDGSGSTNVTYALKTPGGDSGLVDTATGEKVMLSLAGGQVQGRTETSNLLVFTVSLDGSNNVVLDQLRAVVHPNANDPNETRTIVAKYSVEGTGIATDADGDSTTTKIEVNGDLAFKDDGPSITADITNAPTLTVDDSNFAINDTDGFAAQFTPVFGNDGAGATPVTYALSTPGGASGLVDTATKQAVNLSSVGGVIQGRTAVSNDLVFTVSVDSLGNVTLDQLRSVVHANTADPNDTTTLASAGLVVLTATATDKDADHASVPLNIGLQLIFADDGPTIGPISDAIVDFIAGATVTKSLNGVIGNDPNGAPYTIDSFTASLTVNGVLLKGVASGNNTVVTYFADTNNDTVFGNAGDTAFYRLTLGQAGAGTYTFDVLVTPPPADLVFDFDDLPSGQNLFGTVGDTTNALVVIGKVPVLNADGTFTNASNTINTSQGGGGVTIGVNNQMFDPGDGAYFTLVKSPVANFLSGAAGGLDQNEADDADNIQYTGGTLETTSSFTTISQTQGNSLATMKITAFDIANAPQGQAFTSGLGGGSTPTITSVKVNGVAVSFQVSGNGVTVSGLDAGDKVEWTTSSVHDRVLIECVAGKFDIGAFGTTQVAPTPDQVLNFVARATDGDGDFATDGWSIGIDGTGIFDDDDVVLPA